MKISDSLLKKYNGAVPRYTSYPPANHFTNDFTPDRFIQLVNDSNQKQPENLAFYVHIPFCRKICYYCGCNSCATGNGGMIKPYIEALKKELAIISPFLDKTRKISQVHYGGGTPNSIDIAFLKEINNLFFSEFELIENAEIAIECNPEFLDYKSIDELVSAGFNRFSLGIQDFDEEVLRNVNRTPSRMPAEELFVYLKRKNKNFSINLDFIYGLPGQTTGSFSKTIEKAVEIRPDRMVTFSYAHVPWLKKHQLILEKKGLPAPEEKMNMFLTAYDMLKSSGYEALGLDHFVLPGDDLYRAYSNNQLHRNFQGYCTRRTTGQVYALGVTAISQLEDGYSQNTHDLDQYISSVEKGVIPVERGCVLDDNQKITREVINTLMCNKKLNLDEIALKYVMKADTLKDLLKYDDNRLAGFVEDGLLEVKGNEFDVTETGTMFIRNIAVCFDRDYSEKAGFYSKTV